MRIETVRFETADPGAVARFYGDELGFPTERVDGAAVVDIGGTTVRFVASETPRSYHFAADVPENRATAAHDWLDERTDVLRSPDGDTLVHFAELDYHAVYTTDPAGNLFELSARHKRETSTTESFGADSVLRVTEVGMVTMDVFGTIDFLERTVGATPLVDDSAGRGLVPVGTLEGMIVVARRDDPWFMTGDPAVIHPVVIEVDDADTTTHHPFEPHTISH